MITINFENVIKMVSGKKVLKNFGRWNKRYVEVEYIEFIPLSRARKST